MDCNQFGHNTVVKCGDLKIVINHNASYGYQQIIYLETDYIFWMFRNIFWGEGIFHFFIN